MGKSRADITIGLVAGCYKRPELAERLLDSMERYCANVTCACIVLQPEDWEHTPKERSGISVIWHRHPQMFYALARNLAAEIVMDEFAPDILWVLDDDIYATGYTKIFPLLPLLARPDTGIVSPTQQKKEQFVPGDEHLVTSLPLITGGYMLRPRLYKEIGGFTMDGAEERDFCLRIYLRGYVNYRSTWCYVKHPNRRVSTGGLYALTAEAAAGVEGLQQGEDTQYDQNHQYLRSTPVGLTYGKEKTSYNFAGSDLQLTEEAKALHKKNHQRFEVNDG